MMMRYCCCGLRSLRLRRCRSHVIGHSLRRRAPRRCSSKARIPLGDVKGRIDHLAIDLSRRRLFVAELGNDTVGIVDLNERKVQHVITGLKEPQGVGYVPSSDTLFVTNAGDGSVLLFRRRGLRSSGQNRSRR